MRNNEAEDPNVAACAATQSLGAAEPMKKCDKPPFVDGGVTGLKLTEAPEYQHESFQRVHVCMWREC